MIEKRSENIYFSDDKVKNEFLDTIRDSFIPAFRKLAEMLETKIDEVGKGF